MGPILPQINVFGKQLGISPDVMGFITSILPILYVVAKPGVGYLIDSFPVSPIRRHREMISKIAFVNRISFRIYGKLFL